MMKMDKNKIIIICVAIIVLLISILCVLLMSKKTTQEQIDDQMDTIEDIIDKNIYICEKEETDSVKESDIAENDDNSNDLGNATIYEKNVISFSEDKMNIKYTIKYSFTTKYSYDYYKVIATINKNLISHYFDEDKLTKSFTLEYKDINVSEDNSQGILKSYEDNSFKCSKA